MASRDGPGDTAEVRLFQYVRDLASLRLDIKPFEDDVAAIARDEFVHYAIDTNVIFLFTRPNAYAAALKTTDVGWGYGAVFHDDEPESVTLLATNLARFIFYSVTARLHLNTPLVLLPGHDAEIRGYFDYLAERFSNEQEELEKTRDGLVRVLHAIKNQPHIEERLAKLRDTVPTLHRYLTADSAANEFAKLNSILRDGRIARLSQIAIMPHLLLARPMDAFAVRESFSAPANMKDQIEESQFRMAWSKRLSEKRGRRLTRDVSALARLELINRRIEPLRHRLVLISGDDRIFDAASSYVQPGADRSFAEAYLRRPRAFLAANEVLLPSETELDDVTDENTRIPSLGFVSDWLETFLARFTTDNSVSTGSLRKLVDGASPLASETHERVRHALSIDADAPDLVRQQWQLHIDNIAQQHAATSKLARDEIASLLGEKLDADLESALLELNARLATISAETWQTFFDALTVIGFDLAAPDGEPQIRRRNIPAITFVTLPNARQFIRVLMARGGFNRLKETGWEPLLRGLDEDDCTGYAKTLAFALLFAYAGRWHVAAILARRATELAEQNKTNPQPQTFVSGREGYYFRAVATRLQTRQPAQLAQVEALLDKADDACEFERQSGVDSPKYELRFEAERSAVKLTHLLFDVFEATGRTQTRIIERQGVCRRLLAAFQSVVERADSLPDQWIQKNVRRNALTNVFMVAALMDEAALLTLADEQRLQNLVATYLENLRNVESQGTPDIPITSLVDAVRFFALARFSLRGEFRSVRRAFEKLSLSLENSAEAHAVMPYDRERFQLLVSAIRRAAARQG